MKWRERDRADRERERESRQRDREKKVDREYRAAEFIICMN